MTVDQRQLAAQAPQQLAAARGGRHDLAGLTRIADRVLLFDPERRTLVDVPIEESRERLESLEPPAMAERREPTPSGRLMESLARFADGTPIPDCVRRLYRERRAADPDGVRVDTAAGRGVFRD